MGRDDFFSDTHDIPHPGEILREDILPRLTIGQKDFARHLGISTWTLVQILSERQPISLDIAMRLGAALGHGAHYWIGMQAQYDLACANSLPAPEVRKVSWWARSCRSAGVTGSFDASSEFATVDIR